MILLCTKKELEKLQSKLVIVKDFTNNDKLFDGLSDYIETKSPVTDEVIKIKIATQLLDLDNNQVSKIDKDGDVDTIVKSSIITDNAYLSNEQYWKLFLNRVPNNIEHGVWTKDNPHTGKRILKSNKNGERLFLMNIKDNKISAKTMLIAYAYDLYSYRKDSKEENKLRYMLSLDNWLCDINRIETLFTEACNDAEFMKYYSKDPVNVEQNLKEKETPFTSLDEGETEEYEF